MEVIEILHEWCGQENVKRADRLSELAQEVGRLRAIMSKTLDWMRHTAATENARWLRMKYISIYKELTGTTPPHVKSNTRRR